LSGHGNPYFLQPSLCPVSVFHFPHLRQLYPLTASPRVLELSSLTVRSNHCHLSKEDVPTWCKQFYYDFFS